METILELRDVSKTYTEGGSEVKAVDAVSLSLLKGEVLLLMGPSGSGKTTLLSMMGCILRPSSGGITVDGTEVNRLEEKALPDVRKRYFGFVFQSFNLFPSLTAVENIELVLRMKGFAGKSPRPEALGLLDKVGLGDRAYFFPGDLSGGQKQRIAFARALVGDPPILLADEPTANLDSKRGNEVLDLLRKRAKEQGRAVVIVSHDPKAEAVADRVIFLEDGRIRV
ncbi:MAG: ABC transporter ATP-binding protein [Nitrospiraceae bacterium]|nr:ABC transporter ATP-binding protein [Nitrospiraceae bacterium]